MRDRTLRTIGASVILAGVAVAGLAQLAEGRDEQPAQIDVAESATTSAEQARSVAEAPTTSAPAPFVYRVGVLSSVTTDNFWSYYGARPSVWNSYVLGPTKPALYSLDPVTGGLQPEMILGNPQPTWSEEGWRLRIDLSDEFRWSDGTPVTADDFVFTYDTVRTLDLGGSWADAYPSAVESLHADDDYTLRVEFSARPNLRVWPHGVGLAPVMARHVWEPLTEGQTAAGLYEIAGDVDVSGGPLQLVESSESLSMSNANPGYPGGIGPDVVEYHVYPDDEALVAAVAAGEIDTALSPQGVAPSLVEALSADDRVKVVASEANGIRYLGFNLRRAPMSDLAFRTALALLVDREGLASGVGTESSAVWSFIPQANSQWFDGDGASQNQIRYEGDLASRLNTALEGLRAAGYEWSTPPTFDGAGLVAGDGLTIDGQKPQPLTILTPGDAYDPSRPEYVDGIAGVLQTLGFDARPVPTDFDTVVDLAFTPAENGALQYDMYLLGWTLGSPDLPEFYRPFFATDGEMNNTGYSSPTFDQALSRYESAYTKEEARTALWDMEDTLAGDLPYLLLYSSRLTEIYRTDRVVFDINRSLGGIQGRLGGIGDVRPAN